jgi:hypothetical protein
MLPSGIVGAEASAIALLIMWRRSLQAIWCGRAESVCATCFQRPSPFWIKKRYLSDSTYIKSLADGSSNTAEDSNAVARAMGALYHLSAKGLRQLAIKATFLPQMYKHLLMWHHTYELR